MSLPVISKLEMEKEKLRRMESLLSSSNPELQAQREYVDEFSRVLHAAIIRERSRYG